MPNSSRAYTAAKNAIKQIIDKGYGLPFTDPVLVGLGISEERRKIDSCVYMENNKPFKLELTKHRSDFLKDIEIKRPANRPKEPPKPGGPKP